MRLRHQLAAFSPINAARIPHDIVAATGLLGDPRERLAALLKSSYSADRVALCGSGTQALQLAIRIALDAAGQDATVALPAFSCFDMASGAIGANATRVAFYDVDSETLSPDLASLERVLVAGARVIVAAPLYGVPIAWDSINELAERHGAILIEDAAQGHGASWRGRPLGTLGEISTLSFGRGKGWTGGNGGAVLVRGGKYSFDDETLIALGMIPEAKSGLAYLAQWGLGRPSVYGLPRLVPGLELGLTRYHPPRAAARIARTAAAFAFSNARASSEEAARRRANAREYLAALGGLERVGRVRVAVDAEPGYLRFPVRIRSGLDRIAGADDLRRLGVERSYPMVLPELPAIGPMLVAPDIRYPGAERLVEELATLPTHSRVSAGERARIVRLLDRA